MDQNKSRLVEIVGNARVIDHPESGASFSLDHKLTLTSKPSLLVKPGDVDEVQDRSLGERDRRH
jgi:hypothetical protein